MCWYNFTFTTYIVLNNGIMISFGDNMYGVAKLKKDDYTVIMKKYQNQLLFLKMKI